MELISRVKGIAEKKCLCGKKKKFLTLVICIYWIVKSMPYVSDQVCELTYKEYELLKLLMSNAGDCDCERYDHGAYLERVQGESRTFGYAYQDLA